MKVKGLNQAESQTLVTNNVNNRGDTLLKVDMTTPYVKDFQIEGNQITKISDFNKLYSQIVIN
jgi:hypothetical protein